MFLENNMRGLHVVIFNFRGKLRESLWIHHCFILHLRGAARRMQCALKGCQEIKNAGI
jgi:hypothetical protein